MQLLTASFTGAQLTLIIVVSLLCVVLLAGNAVLLYLFFRKRKRRTLSDLVLQHKREQLLEELTALRQMPDTQALDDEEEDEDEDVLSEAESESVFAEAEDEDELDDEGENEGENEGEEEVLAEGGSTFNAEILAVKDMSPEMREKFGFTGEEYQRKRYYIRPTYSFEAKLRASSDEVKDRYMRIFANFKKYERVNNKMSFRRERIYIGRKTVALLLFKGKKLCVAFALDPAQYAETKYRGEDVSDKKCFAQTPMLVRVTSDRRFSVVLYLIARLAAENGVSEKEKPDNLEFDLGRRNRNRLFAENKLKITILGEAPDLEDDAEESDGLTMRAGILAVKDMSAKMREAFALVGNEFNGKRYYVRYNYSFEAKLRSAKSEMKERFQSFMDEGALYHKLTAVSSFRNMRLRCRRKTLVQLFFKGKTLCVAFALDPKIYQDTKYRGEDLSGTKRFAQTPLVLKLTSSRRLGYAKYLLTVLAQAEGLEITATPDSLQYDVKTLTRNELFAKKLLKINIIGEVPQK